MLQSEQKSIFSEPSVNYEQFKQDKSGLSRLDLVTIRLIPERPLYSKDILDTPTAAVHLLGREIGQFNREVVAVINLDARMHPINASIISMGGLNYSVFDGREILKTALLSNANVMMIMHNHPSGFLDPSQDDIDATHKLVEAGNIIGLTLVDHIIVGPDPNEFYSFRENGILEEVLGRAHGSLLEEPAKDSNLPDI